MPSELTERILSVEPAVQRNNPGRKGTAPAIRKLKTRFPEMTQPQIAKRVGCSVDNVQKVLRRYHRDTTVEDLRGYQENKADLVDQLAHRVITHISEAKLKKMSAAQSVISLGVLIDKSQLLRGLATGINVSVLMDVAEAIRARSEAHRHGVSESAATTLDAKR